MESREFDGTKPMLLHLKEARGRQGAKAAGVTSTAPCGLAQRLGLEAYQPLTPQERFRLCRTNPQIVVSLISAALRIRSDSSIEHLRSIVVLGPGGRVGVLESVRFNVRNLTAFAHSPSSKSTNLMTMFSI